MSETCPSCGLEFTQGHENEDSYYCANCGSTNPKVEFDNVQITIP